MSVKKVIFRIVLPVVIVVGLGFLLKALFLPVPVCSASWNRVSTVEELDACIEKTVEAHDLPGMAVAVVANGGVAWSEGYGYANIEDSRPATPDTPFLLASISKVVTGTALMQAWEEGAFSLDDEVGDLVPFTVDNPRVEGEVITVRHLATHTSGIEDNYDVYDQTYAPGDPEMPLGEFLESYLSPEGEYYDREANFSEYMPGENYSYSNIAAGLAGYLMETTTGIPLNVHCRERIFEPLGMHNTGWFLSEFENVDEIAVPYKSGEAGRVALEHYGFATWPDGLLRASANDLARFMAAFMNGGQLDGAHILEESTVEMMLEPQFPDAKMNFIEYRILIPRYRQAIFWHSYKGWYGHDGGDEGAITFMYFDPDSQVGAVVLINQADAASFMAGQRLLHLILHSGDNLNSTLPGS